MKDRDWVLKKARKSKKDKDWKETGFSEIHATIRQKQLLPSKPFGRECRKSKGFWKCIKSIFPTKTATFVGGNNKSQNFVNKCSKYFFNAVSKLKQQVILLTNQLKSLKRNKSDGIDGFPPGMLKNCHKEISQPLLHIINVSLNSGIVPSSWKIAKVVPIHKKGTTTDLVIIAHYPFSKFCRRCSKKQYTVNQWITLKVRTC